MGDWIDRLTKRDAQAILDAEVKTRIPARDERQRQAVASCL